MNLEQLNSKYASMSPEERIAAVYSDFKNVLLTSSFGTTSVYLLSLFSKVKPEQVVHFLDTTYHFKETLEYKKQLSDLFNLNVVDLKGDDWRVEFTQKDETWKKDPDLCCSVNKVEPLEKIKPDYDVWVSGLMAGQTTHRNNINIFEERHGIVKFHPLIDVKFEDAEKYIKENNLPEHPLKKEGYGSIGCIHCTTKGRTREGRWINKSKTECGLHL